MRYFAQNLFFILFKDSESGDDVEPQRDDTPETDPYPPSNHPNLQDDEDAFEKMVMHQGLKKAYITNSINLSSDASRPKDFDRNSFGSHRRKNS